MLRKATRIRNKRPGGTKGLASLILCCEPKMAGFPLFFGSLSQHKHPKMVSL